MTKDGFVYSCGINDEGQLVQMFQVNTKSPGKMILSNEARDTIISNEEIANVFPIGERTFVLTKSGAIYGCGINKYGELGFGDQKNRSLPIKITALSDKEIINVIGNKYSSFFLTKSGAVYHCGVNPNIQGVSGSDREICEIIRDDHEGKNLILVPKLLVTDVINVFCNDHQTFF